MNERVLTKSTATCSYSSLITTFIPTVHSYQNRCLHNMQSCLDFFLRLEKITIFFLSRLKMKNGRMNSRVFPIFVTIFAYAKSDGRNKIVENQEMNYHPISNQNIRFSAPMLIHPPYHHSGCFAIL